MLPIKVAVVILNWNGKSFLEKFLPHVILHSSPAQIYIADNASSDDSILFIKNNYPQVQLIQNPSNQGFAKGYNTALKQINAEYYILLNSDVEVTEHWIEPVISLMDAHTRIAACQPKILDYTKKNTFEYAGAAGGFIDKYGYPFCRGRIFNELEIDHQQYNDAREVFWATGACLFVKSKAFWEVGGFDDDYFAHMEEIDVCWRLKNSGYEIYIQPASTIFHVGGGTLNKISPKKTFLNFRNNLITLTKNADSKLLAFKILYRMVLDGVAAFKFLFEGNAKHFLAVIKAHFSYYSMLPSTLAKRKKMKSLPNFKFTTSCIYKKNIVYAHFVKGIKSFTEIEF